MGKRLEAAKTVEPAVVEPAVVEPGEVATFNLQGKKHQKDDLNMTQKTAIEIDGRI